MLYEQDVGKFATATPRDTTNHAVLGDQNTAFPRSQNTATVSTLLQEKHLRTSTAFT